MAGRTIQKSSNICLFLVLAAELPAICEDRNPSEMSVVRTHTIITQEDNNAEDNNIMLERAGEL